MKYSCRSLTWYLKITKFQFVYLQLFQKISTTCQTQNLPINSDGRQTSRSFLASIHLYLKFLRFTSLLSLHQDKWVKFVADLHYHLLISLRNTFEFSPITFKTSSVHARSLYIIGQGHSDLHFLSSAKIVTNGIITTLNYFKVRDVSRYVMKEALIQVAFKTISFKTTIQV